MSPKCNSTQAAGCCRLCGRFTKTVLMEASYFGHTRVVEVLIAAGADVAATNEHG